MPFAGLSVKTPHPRTRAEKQGIFDFFQYPRHFRNPRAVPYGNLMTAMVRKDISLR
jgi:hypothetical protein